MLRLTLPPPANWQDFEELCLDLWSRLWNDPNAQKHGRSGQGQQGIDVFGRPDQGHRWAGVQCKNTLQSSGKMSASEIEGLIEKARRFEPSLAQLIIATTAPRDAQLQAIVRTIDDRERQAGSFPVTIFAWDDIVSKLSDYPELLRKYYPGYFRQLDQVAAGMESRIEVRVDPDHELDYFALIPAFSTTDPSISADLTVLAVALSGIEVINHDSQATELLRIRVEIPGENPRDVMEQVLRPDYRRLEAHSRRTYDLKFTAAFEGPPANHRRDGAILCVETIGFGMLQIPLDRLFRDQARDAGLENGGALSE
jgi:hypothetical protein